MSTKLVIFEGPDKVGKTTLFKAFREATRYIPLAIDRFTGSNIAYDQYYNRGTDLAAYYALERKIQEATDCYLIGLVCDPVTLMKRISSEEVGAAKEIALANFREILDLFHTYYNTTQFKKVRLFDTSLLSVEDCLEHALEFTGEVLR